MNNELPARPAHLPPEISPNAPPNRGGPWTKRHAAAEIKLRGQLAEIEALANPAADESRKRVLANDSPWPPWGNALVFSIVLGAAGAGLIVDGAASTTGLHWFLPSIGGTLIALAGRIR